MATKAKALKQFTDVYQTYTVQSTGEEIKVYGVPLHIARGVKLDKPKPKRPVIEMPIKGGGNQKRWIKQGDEGWDDYQAELEEWEEQQDALQRDVTLCLALRDYPIPEDLSFPAHIQELVADGMYELPTNKWQRKALWLRTCAIGQHDELEIGWMQQELSGVPRELVEQMRDSFRNLLLGQESVAMGDGTEQHIGTIEDDQGQ